MKGLSQLMRQAQEMQANMQKAQEELASTEVCGDAGGGMVKVRMTCRHDVRRVLDPAVICHQRDRPARAETQIAAGFGAP